MEFISPLLHIVAIASEIVAEVSTASFCNHFIGCLYGIENSIGFGNLLLILLEKRGIIKISTEL